MPSTFCHGTVRSTRPAFDMNYSFFPKLFWHSSLAMLTRPMSPSMHVVGLYEKGGETMFLKQRWAKDKQQLIKQP